MKKLIILLFGIFVFNNISFSQDVSLYEWLKTIPGTKIKKYDSPVFKEFYEIYLPQLLDHKNPNGKVFKQLIYLGYNDVNAPTVIETDGYSAKRVSPKFIDEPAKILKANMIFVEHRFFNKSVPDSMDWKYLNMEQVAGDYHYIRNVFGKFLKGKWVATGISKGGQTATAYKLFFPDDVDATIAYVASMNYSLLDPRIDKHFKIVGTPECRKNIYDYQVEMLKNKNKLLPIFKDFARRDSLIFNFIDAETAYEYCVLEFPFSFWQWVDNCKIIENIKVPDDSLVKILYKVIYPDLYSNSIYDLFPSYFQNFTELGYYEYDETPFKEWLKKKDYPNTAFNPPGVKVVFNDTYIKKLKDFIKSGPKNMIFIYGELDPWGAPAIELNDKSNSLKFVVKNGSHGVRIRHLDAQQKEQVYSTLEKWLGIKIDR
ncbi:MAG: S28 family serine protease [Bacteroidales bacterium]|nr:S28 family serine protease [Bacteroidales bacterium]